MLVLKSTTILTPIPAQELKDQIFAGSRIYFASRCDLLTKLYELNNMTDIQKRELEASIAGDKLKFNRNYIIPPFSNNICKASKYALNLILNQYLLKDDNSECKQTF